MSLWQDFMTNDQKVIHKFVHYFPIYEKYFSAWRNKSVTFFEIGVARGGSLQMWQRYFGPLAKIVGVDLNPACKAHQTPGIFVRIGDQSDHAFLQRIIDEFGAPDIVVDDGSHQMKHIASTFDFLYRRMHKNAIYLVEDLQSAYMEEYGGGMNKSDTFIEIAKRCIDKLYAGYPRLGFQPDMITKETFGISFYPGVVCFEKGDVFWRQALKFGAADASGPAAEQQGGAGRLSGVVSGADGSDGL